MTNCLKSQQEDILAEKTNLCWGTYAYMHICTKSIQIYVGIFFDFILVLHSFHCSHTIPIFSKFYSLQKPVTLTWHCWFCFHLSTHIPTRLAESNCIICNACAHLGMLSGVEAGGRNRIYTGKRIYSQLGNMHWKVDEHLKYLINFPKRKYSLEISNLPTIFWSGEFSSIFNISLEYSDPGYAWNT